MVGQKGGEIEDKENFHIIYFCSTRVALVRGICLIRENFLVANRRLGLFIY